MDTNILEGTGPSYENNCDHCQFLGRHQEFDLYFCDLDGTPKASIRLGNKEIASMHLVEERKETYDASLEEALSICKEIATQRKLYKEIGPADLKIWLLTGGDEDGVCAAALVCAPTIKYALSLANRAQRVSDPIDLFSFSDYHAREVTGISISNTKPKVLSLTGD
jgi:hypothetical protein